VLYTLFDDAARWVSRLLFGDRVPPDRGKAEVGGVDIHA
jgi:hypothetical protein